MSNVFYAITYKGAVVSTDDSGHKAVYDNLASAERGRDAAKLLGHSELEVVAVVMRLVTE